MKNVDLKEGKKVKKKKKKTKISWKLGLKIKI